MLVYCDSFDHYTTLTDKGWTVNGVSATSAVGRFSTNGVRFNSNFYFMYRPITTGDVFIVSLMFRVNALPQAGNPGSIIGLFDGSDGQIYILINSTGFLTLSRGQPSGILNQGFTTLATSGSAITTGIDYHLEAKFTIGNSGAGVANLNGASLFNFTGDTQASGNAQATGFIVGNISNAGTFSMDIDDLIIMDDSGSFMNDLLGDKRVIALLPAAEGNYSDFTPSTGIDNAALVDEATPNDDTDYVSSATPGNKDTYTFGNLSETVASIEALVANHRARKDDAGTREIQALVRSGGTDENGATKTLTSSYAYYQSPFYEDPDTSAAWDVPGVNAVEVGQEVVT